MSSAARPLQVAIYGALSGDAALMALVTGVYDAVPDGATLPYVTIGEIELHDDSTFGRGGQVGPATINVWTQGEGKKSCQEIQSRIDTLMNDATLTVAGFQFIAMVREFERVVEEQDGLGYHGVQRFRAFVCEL